MKRTIHALHWDEVTSAVDSAWAPAIGRVFVLWPAPVDVDACLEKAGFRDFRDSDEQWHAEFAMLTESLLNLLTANGAASIQEGEYPVRTGAGEALRRILGFRNKGPGILEVVLSATNDDNFPPCLIHFGNPARAALRVSDGHPIFWVWLADVSADFDSSLAALATDRVLTQTSLDWPVLA